MVGMNDIYIALCSDTDLPACFSAMSRGFGHDAPFFDTYFPDHDTVIGQSKGTERLLAWKKSAPDSKFLKAVLRPSPEGQEKIIGFAVWTYMKEPPSANLDELEAINDLWPDANDAEYMRRLWKKYVIPRSDAITSSNGAGIYVLELLSVDTAYQRQGAGLALVRWGTDKADEAGVDVSDLLRCGSQQAGGLVKTYHVVPINFASVTDTDSTQAIVESTPMGRRTYEKGGLRATIEEMDLDAGTDFAARTKPVLIFMKRTKS